MTTNYDSVLLVGTLNAFAKKTKNGIIDFETYADNPDKYDGWLVYDSSNNKVVADMCVDGSCRDIIDYYDFFPDVQIGVMTPSKMKTTTLFWSCSPSAASWPSVGHGMCATMQRTWIC